MDVNCFLSVPRCFLLGNAPPLCMWPGGLSVKKVSATSGQLTNGNMTQEGPSKMRLRGLIWVLGEGSSSEFLHLGQHQASWRGLVSL